MPLIHVDPALQSLFSLLPSVSQQFENSREMIWFHNQIAEQKSFPPAQLLHLYLNELPVAGKFCLI